MNAFLKPVERVKAALVGRQLSNVTLVYADASRNTVGILAAVDEICRREDVVDVLAQDETTSSLLRGMLDPWDFSDLEELAEQQ